MKRSARLVLAVAVAAQAGCATTHPAGVSRIVAVDPAQLSTTPVCFVPPPRAQSPLERANLHQIIGLCERAARKNNVSVVPFGTAGCLAATMSWSSRETGELDASCAWGACRSDFVRNKSVALHLSRQPDGAPVVETVAILRSVTDAFTPQTFFGLCNAAFHQYPRPLKNLQFNVATEE